VSDGGPEAKAGKPAATAPLPGRKSER
jgi:hypothetical protein